ncbi:hypothetical protein [Nannocystis punicea]|uniref:Dickkopf N-terminal cysteine-rich domain-containing protein n=1 Tax=Nannocystis punicea TaxID=2995304 RepID=A0ABY7GSG4_9BACT|nr:hypothetical protein [Nannocystis poenicansa]WAS89883.1 hypothetical protein O0S08_27130 [Nannocystis poenicansa]
MRRLVIVTAALACACNEPAGRPAGVLPTGTTAAGAEGDEGTTGPAETGDEATAGSLATEGTTGPVQTETCMELTPIREEEFAARFAHAVCGQKAACGCALPPDCVDRFARQFEAVRTYARIHAPHYDGACAAAVLADTVETRGCNVKSQFYQHDWCQLGCEVFRGDVPHGRGCGESVSTDLAAFIDVCADPGDACGILGTRTCESLDAIPTVGRGDECLSSDSATLSNCEEGLWCNYDSRVCVPEVGIGENCGDFAECTYDAWCDAQAVCQPALAHGEPCDGNRQCLSLTCTGGRCDDYVILCRVDSPSDLLFPFTL